MNLTVVIPTYNRPNDLKRLVEFLCHQDHAGISFIVADSSNPENREVNEVTTQGLGELARYMGFESDIRPMDKFALAAKAVETEFVVFCADDDLLKIDTVKKCKKFLQKHHDYAACHGLYVVYDDHDDKANISRIEYDGASLKYETPYERIIDFLSNYEAIFYAVTRKDLIYNSLDASLKCNLSLHKELIQGACLAIAGKVKRIPDLYSLRYPVDGTIVRKYWQPLEALAEIPDKMFTDYVILREALIDFSKKIDKDNSFDYDTLCKSIDFAYMNYLYFSIDLRNVASIALPKSVSKSFFHLSYKIPPTLALSIKDPILLRIIDTVRQQLPTQLLNTIKNILRSQIVATISKIIKKSINRNKFSQSKDVSHIKNFKSSPQINDRLSSSEKVFLEEVSEIMFRNNKK